MSRLGLASDGTWYCTACAAVRTRQDGERNVLKFSRSAGLIGLYCRKGPKVWMAIPSSIIVINIRGCVLGVVVPTSRLGSTIWLLATSADKSVVLHVDSPINESRHPSVLLPASILLPATSTTSLFSRTHHWLRSLRAEIPTSQV